MVQVFIPFPHQVPKGPQTNLTVNPLQMLAGRAQYLPPLEGSTDKGYCKLFTFYKCRPWILGDPFLGHWDSGYLGSKVQGPRIREHKDRFQANGSTAVREGAKFKSGQMVVKKVKWTYFHAYLWQTMWNHTKKSMEGLKLSDSVFSRGDVWSS